MIPAQRRAVLLDFIQQRGAASIKELARHSSFSESTVRRDLDFLNRHGYLQRSYGGANLPTLPSTTFEPDFAIGVHQNHEAKRAIGKLAAGRVENGWSVIFDSSSTVLEAAKEVVKRGVRVTALTNDLNIAMLFAPISHAGLVVPGGTLRQGSYTLVGEPGGDFLDRIHVDIAFVGVHSVAERSLSDTSIDVVATKRKLIRASRRVVVLADASKFGLAAFCEITTLEKVDELITDSRISSEQLEAARAHGATVTVAGAPADLQAAGAPE
ncbi:MAG: DeoR/GlpR family DNA-binding transcription regulator [Deinococcota bacterium]|nr:DeoR/GlpR family DNA-binding transcription regulator [Deinococcota bacterium]